MNENSDPAIHVCRARVQPQSLSEHSRALYDEYETPGETAFDVGSISGFTCLP